jgi:regulator of sigma E protease
MLQILQTLLAFIGALGLLVTIHEYGHYQVARSLGIRILRFSVGFGPALWSRRFGADQTEFVIAAIPLGGYVKMLDEREGPIDPSELHRAFNTQNVWKRIAVVAAGPLANLALAFCLYWLMFMAGVSGPKPFIGEVKAGGFADVAGLQAGDEIIAVDGQPTAIWDNVLNTAIEAILDARRVELTTRHKDGTAETNTLDLATLSVDDLSGGMFFDKLGFKPQRPQLPARIGKLVPGGAAEQAGLLAGDLLLTLNGETIEDWSVWVERIRANAGKPLQVGLKRDGLPVTLTVVPHSASDGGKLVGRIGAEVAIPDASESGVAMGIERFGALEAIRPAAERTCTVALNSLKFMHRMLVGEASTNNLSGPISIAQFAGASARMGLSRFLEFMALVSVSLGIMNLLPVPVLDGGHLMYYLVEAIMRRPLPERVQAYGQHLGLMALMGLMGLALYNDIMRSF